MRRAPIVLTSTVVGTAAVLTFQPRHPELASSAVASAAPNENAAPSADPSTGGSGSAGSSGSGGPSGSSDSSSSGGSALSGTHVATGEAVDTVYGAAQVRVTVTDGKITKVEAVQLQSRDPKSVSISNYAAPLLAQSALEKQSAAIDAVSGATYTSGSYAASLQSALDQLGFKAADGSTASTDVSGLQQGERGDGGTGGDDGPGDDGPGGDGPGDWN